MSRPRRRADSYRPTRSSTTAPDAVTLVDAARRHLEKVLDHDPALAPIAEALDERRLPARRRGGRARRIPRRARRRRGARARDRAGASCRAHRAHPSPWRFPRRRARLPPRRRASARRARRRRRAHRRARRSGRRARVRGRSTRHSTDRPAHRGGRAPRRRGDPRTRGAGDARRGAQRRASSPPPSRRSHGRDQVAILLRPHPAPSRARWRVGHRAANSRGSCSRSKS